MNDRVQKRHGKDKDSSKGEDFKKTEHFFRLLIENTSDLVLVLNTKGTILYEAPSIERILGYKPEEIANKNLSDYLHPEDMSHTLEQTAQAIHTPGIPVGPFEMRLHHKDGSWSYMESFARAVVLEPEGTVLVINTRDITAQKRIEENFGLIQFAIDNAMDVIAIVDREGRYVYVNLRECQVLGKTREELLSHTIFDFLPGFTPEMWNTCWALAKTQGCFKHEALGTLANGTTIPFEAWLRYINYGRNEYVCTIARDIAERKQAEQALSEREERFRALVEESSEVILLTLADGRPLYVSPAITGTLGYSQEEYVSKTFLDVLHPDDTAKATELAALVLAHPGTAITATLRERHRDGTYRWIEGTYRNLLDNPSVRACVVNFRDVTEKKQAEDALRTSQHQLSEAMDLAHIVYWEADIATEEIILNDPFFAFYGTTVEQEGGYRMARNECFRRFAPPDHGEAMQAEIQKAYSEPQREIVLQYEYRGMKRDGEVIYILARVRVIKDAAGLVIRVYGANQDITERKWAEENLRRSEEKYRDIFERAVEGFFQATPEWRILSVNPAHAHLFGYTSPEEFLADADNTRESVYVHPEERVSFQRAVESAGSVIGSEHQLVRKDGTKIWVSINAKAIRDARGKSLYYEGTVVDITERKQAEEERAKLQAQLRQSQKMEAIGTLAGGVAHDFNNILTVITGYGALLQMEMNATDPLCLYVDQMLSASHKAASLTQSLLAFSRQQPITLNPLNINDIINGTESLLRRLLTEDIELRITLDAEDHTVLADTTQIDQILFNLVTNARDAMPKGGVLAIKTELVQLNEDSAKLHGFIEPGQYVMMSVADTGIGMDETTREQIFDPFFTTKEVGKGTGLGLSTVYGIVKQHKGYMTLYSEPNMGATFHIYLPTSKVLTTEIDESSTPTKIKRGSESILIAEDNAEVRRLMIAILTEQGYTVVEADDGRDALEKFIASKKIDLLILDSVMPGKNGREVYDEIIKLKPHIKTIFTSGYTRDVVLDKGIEEKAFDFIPKPFTRNGLLQKVREVLDRNNATNGMKEAQVRN